jgi:hypothetical protein
MAARIAAFSCSVRSTKAKDLPAKRDQKAWQVMEQKDAGGRDFVRRTGSNQPKPRDARLQTAQGGEAT